MTLHGVGAGTRRSLLALYYHAVASLQATLGVVLRREMTLREYLSAVAARIPALSQAFAGLTALAERALYARPEPDLQDVSTGRELLASMEPERRDAAIDGREEPH